jgi:hypothetical protein
MPEYAKEAKTKKEKMFWFLVQIKSCFLIFILCRKGQNSKEKLTRPFKR